MTPALWTQFASGLVHADWRALTLLRAAIVVVLAALLVWLLRRGPAKQRHAIWSLSLGLIAVLPAVGVWMASPARGLLSSATGTLGGASSVATALIVLWLAGVLAVVAKTVTGLVIAQRLRVRAERIREPVWDLELETARSWLGIRRPVELRRSDRIAVPIAFGWRRPVVLLPLDCGDWTDDRRRAVMLHELAHLARHDWIARLLELALCAAYWFHPLVWWAAARRRGEAERACDETVIAHGISRRSYAAHLLAFAGKSRVPTSSPAIAIAGGHVRELEARIRGILSPAAPAGRRHALASTLILVVMTGASLTLSSPGPVCAMTQSASAARSAQDVGVGSPAPEVPQPR